MTRLCYFGGYDPDYPRNRILRAGLAAHGVQLTQCRAPAGSRAWRRYAALTSAFGEAARGSDTLLVAEFCHKDMPLARLLKGRRRLVFDPLVSREDTLVGDWRKHAPGSPQARWNRLIDRLSLGFADLVLCDTWAQGDLYAGLGVRRDRLLRAPVGAERAFFEVPDLLPRDPVRLLYVGGFLPLHGVPVVLEAAARLESRRDLAPYALELAGSGRDFEACRTRARELGLASVSFPGPVPYADLARRLAGADVALGVFAPAGKVGRVIPHKVYQGLAAGRAVLTGDSPALRELFTPGEHLAAVPLGDPDALAAALARVILDPEWRLRLGRAGRERAREVATPEAVAAPLARCLAGEGSAA